MAGAMSPDTLPETAPTGQVLEPACFERDDAALVALALDGDPGATARLLERCAPRVARLIASVLGTDRDRQDVLQDALEQIVRGLPSLRRPDLFASWARSVALGRVYKHLRSRRRRRWLVFWHDEEPEEPEAPVAGDDLRHAVRALYQILESCPAQERVVFCLRYVEGMKLEEAAKAVGVSLATVKRQLARAERRVQELGASHPDLARFAGGRR